MNRQMITAIGCSSVLLTGCLSETTKPFEVPQLVLFSGMYENPENESYLIFESGKVRYQTMDTSVTRDYSVDDDLISIELNSASSKTGPGLVMRIHNDGKKLTCNGCPGMQLSNVWTRVPEPRQ